MKALLTTLANFYVVEAAVVLYLDYRIFVRFCAEGHYRLTSSGWIRTLSVCAVPALFALICSMLAYLLITRRHRRVAIALAAISCVAVPYGTALGVVTLIALLWPGTESHFDTQLGQTI